MHRSSKFGVLNEWNRPFDVPNVIVSDSSCFTTSTEKNPTLTNIALYWRMSDHLVEKFKHGEI